MSEAREQLGKTTIILHWILAFSIIAMLALGLYLEDLPPGDLKGQLVNIHKTAGVVIFIVAAWRVVWRTWHGFPPAAVSYAAWERWLAKIIHWFLLFATIAMPVSGIMISLGLGYTVPFFGITEFGPLAEKNKLMSDIGSALHGYGGKFLIAALLLHIAGALKHHIFDKAGTLKRMLGAKIE